MSEHRLDALLRPVSLALVGASPRQGSVGQLALANLLEGSFPGELYAVNPRYDSLSGVACYAGIAALPRVPEHVVFAVSDERIEALLDEAIAAGVRAVTIFSALIPAGETHPQKGGLRDRIAARLRRAGVLACGGNGMGFFNFRDRVWACGFDTRSHKAPGNVALISQSGAGMCGIVDCETRIDFALAVSTGQELTVGLEDYLDFAVRQDDIRAVGLFIETCRNPAALRAALAEANARGIPLVALKTGRTQHSARLTVSHSGALAGDDDAWNALFDRYGVQRVRDMDELATALILFARMGVPGPGGLVSLHDSGGERQLLIDLADDCGVPLAPLTDGTRRELAKILDPGLEAVNPLDGWSRGGPDAHETMKSALALLMSDETAAVGALVHDRAPEGAIYPEYVDYLERGHAASGKPVALVASRQGPGSDPLVVSTTRDLGYPVIDGVTGFLTGVRCLFGHRDFQARGKTAPPHWPQDLLQNWRRELAAGETLDQATGQRLLQEFGLPAVGGDIATSAGDAVALWRSIGAPVAMKTARRDILHKSEYAGVYLGLDDADAIEAAWQKLAARLGPAVYVAPMARAGVEMLVGMRHDADFGPLIVFGFGGVHAETLNDVAVALAPFDASTARRGLDGLRLRALLDGPRGAPPCDVDALCEAIARFSALADALAGELREADINPLIAGPDGCVAVDTLIVPTQSVSARRSA